MTDKSDKKKPKVITQLTPEQEKQLEVKLQEWLKIGLCTDPANRPEAEAGVRKAYASAEPPLAEPEIRWADSPKAGLEMAAQLNGTTPAKELSSVIFGQHDANVWAFYDYVGSVLDIDVHELEGLMQVARNAGWWLAYEGLAIITERPLEIHLDDRGDLHNDHGPSIAYRDGYKMFHVHGVQVTEKVVKDDFTWEDIEKEQNAEVRRIMLERYTAERYLKECGAKLVHEDRFGKLWERRIPNDSVDEGRIMFVELLNSTPEPDGSIKTYFLRVDPNAYGGLKTAHAAVASMYRDSEGGLIFDKPEKYSPVRET
jgi:hypothetical protein